MFPRKHGPYVRHQWTWRTHCLPLKENRCFLRLNVFEAFHMRAFVISGASISVGGGISEVEEQWGSKLYNQRFIYKRKGNTGTEALPPPLSATSALTVSSKQKYKQTLQTTTTYGLLAPSRENLKPGHHTLHKQRSFLKSYHLVS